ncbi:MAG: flagellar type III secretion system pore protein FliP [Candidatus Marinimicrobia bacterium]|nr:flagellar type III secretion system pore protein FliP [Candidatus Neomarinimicrobiota bacterium]
MINKKRITLLIIIGIFLLPLMAQAQTAIPKVTFGLENSTDPNDFALSMKLVLFFTVLTLAPSIVIMMTCFTRIIIVFHFLRTAMSTQSVPSNQILVGIALFVTYFVMKPVITEINETAIQPYVRDEITQAEAFQNIEKPIKVFMLKQTREKDLGLFIDLRGEGLPQSKEELGLSIVVPAFIISELKTAFQIGFLLYLPMLLIDIIVASVLLSMGMMMLPPMMISMPMKILLFVLVDGWYLIIESLVEGFV